MSDFNTKVGNNNKNLENVIGKHGIGKQNENGDMLIEPFESRTDHF